MTGIISFLNKISREKTNFNHQEVNPSLSAILIYQLISICSSIAMLKDKIFGNKSSGSGCCGTRIVSLRQVNVGGRSIGIQGLDETFQEYFKMGKTPVDSTGNELVEDLKKLNFIAEEPKRCTRRPS